MKRIHSEIFAPYRFLGVVTGDVDPSVRTTFVGKTSTISVLCPIDNVIMQYNGKKLRAIGMSNPLSDRISAVASSSSCVYAAHGTKISALPFCRDVTDSIDIKTTIKMMTLIGTQLIAVDTSSGIHVIDTSDGLTPNLLLEGSENFEITSMVHPSTYLNKIIAGSSSGHLRIINIRSGKVIHEFQRCFESPITILEQTTALDVLAVGLESGEVLLHNVKLDKILHSFRHDSRITNIGFRDDGESAMVTADENGTMAVWDLEKQELIGKITGVHSNAINLLHFVPGEPIMLSGSLDNSLRTWIFDAADGMPRELVRLEGHSKPAAAVHFVGKNHVLSAGRDGSLRKYDVTSLTMRQKLGSVVDQNQKKTTSTPSEVQNVVEMVFGWQREAAWNNVFCRQVNDTKITAWQSRNNTHGKFDLEHERFKKNVQFIGANATALCISPCGNFVFIGYSTGHIDQFNAQSGRHIHSFTQKPSKKKSKKNDSGKGKKFQSKNVEYDAPAVESKITSLSVDQRGKELMSTDEEGIILFWSIPEKFVTAKVSKKNVKLGMSTTCPSNSLIALVVKSKENGHESVVLIDTVCHKAVREFETVGEKVNAIAFSSDGKWLLVADNDSYIRVFDVSTSQLIDVLLFSKPCISISFNETGEFLATVHEGERAIYVWANKSLFLSYVNIRALAPNFLPTWESRADEPDVCIDDDDDTIMDHDLRAMREMQIDESLITFSGLPPSRWANLPDLALIKERNKPTDAPRKVKQAPFFLSAAATLDGFEFEMEDADNDLGDTKSVISKRSLLELESSFSALLRKATTTDHLLQAFGNLQQMGLSAIDFQIRSLNSETLPIFFRMLLEILKTRQNFELVQAYVATALKAHRNILWKTESEGGEELSEVLSELGRIQESSWNEMENLFVENMAVVQWIKNALL